MRGALARVAAVAAAAGAALAGAWAAPARAGTYTVDIPCYAGTAPPGVDPSGWRRDESPLFDQTAGCAGLPAGWNLSDALASDDGMRISVKPGASFAAAQPSQRTAAWTFLVPGHPALETGFRMDAFIKGFTAQYVLERQGDDAYDVGVFANALLPGATGQARVRGCSAGTVSGRSTYRGQATSDCSADPTVLSYASAGERVTLPGRRTRDISWTIRCPVGECPSDAPGRALLAIRDARFEIEDDTGPEQVLHPGGLDDPTHWLRGAQSLTYDVQDVVGVHVVHLAIDGSRVPGVRFPHCPASDGETITTLEPCPQIADRVHRDERVDVDTAVFPDGRHRGVLAAEDAVGNISRVRFRFQTDNHPPRAFQVRAAHRGIAFRVRDSGSGVASCGVQVRPAGSTAAWTTLATDRRGRHGGLCIARPGVREAPPGSYEVQLVAADRAGNVLVAPGVTIALPAA